MLSLPLVLNVDVSTEGCLDIWLSVSIPTRKAVAVIPASCAKRREFEISAF